MSNNEKLIESFSRALQLPLASITDDLTYNSIPQWDSVAHMILVSDLESTFDVMLDTDDIIDMSSVKKVKEILKKYQIVF